MVGDFVDNVIGRPIEVFVFQFDFLKQAFLSLLERFGVQMFPLDMGSTIKSLREFRQRRNCSLRGMARKCPGQ